MNRNDSSNIPNRLYEILREIVSNRSALDNFSNEFLDYLNCDQEPAVNI
jgi:hypothetical protein